MILLPAAEGLQMILGEGNNSVFAVFPQRYANHEIERTVINVSLGVIVGAIALSIILSLIYPSRYSENEEIEEKMTRHNFLKQFRSSEQFCCLL